jgi:hypothetical protein
MPLFQTVAEFRTWLTEGEPLQLAHELCLSDRVHALPTPAEYERFRLKVMEQLPATEFVAIVGSGNWRFSLNPDKFLVEYHSKSDIDVAVVSQELYQSTWDEMRKLHRERWYTLSADERSRLTRNGQNIYAGFACPIWIPQRGHPTVYSFKSMLNRLSGPELGYREVKMMYFKNQTEMIDYYRRGFEAGKRGIVR